MRTLIVLLGCLSPIFVHGFVYADAGLLLSAERAGSESLLTESGELVDRISDLQHGGIAYIDDQRKTFLSVEKQSETEWLIESKIDSDETVRISLFTVVAPSSWIKLEFRDFQGSV